MFDQILDLIAQPPGSLVYHFIILFAVEAALAISFGQWMRQRDLGTARLTIAIVTVMLARTLVLVASLLAWQGLLPRNVLLPPIERVVDALTPLALVWAFITMDDPEVLERNFLPDVIAAAFVGVMLAGFVGTYYFWSFVAQEGALFNGLWLDAAWGIAQIAIAAVGLIWMLTRARYIYDPFLKGFALIVLAGAAAVHLVSPPFGDVASAVRLGQIVVMPMLAAVAYRHVVDRLLHWDEFEPIQSALPAMMPAPIPSSLPPIPAEPPPLAAPLPRAAPEVEPPPPPRPEKRRADLPVVGEPDETLSSNRSRPVPSPPLLDVVEALSGLLNTLDQDEVVEETTKAVATALRADVCMLAVVDEQSGEAGVLGGYDNITQSGLPGAVLDLGSHPTIVQTMSRLRQSRLTTQRNMRELRDLYAKLGISHQGPAYLQPLVDRDDRIGVLIVGSPYSERQLSNEERNLLDRIGPLVTAALVNAERYSKVRDEGEKTMMEEGARLANLADELTATTADLSDARRQMDEMKAYIRDLHRQMEATRAQQTEIDNLREELERLRKNPPRSGGDNPGHGETGNDAGENGEGIRQARSEIDRLRADNERLLQQLLQQRQQAELMVQQARPTPAPTAEQSSLQQELEAMRQALQGELISLRSRLMQASISQHEVSFLQEQLAVKARETVGLQARLTEAEAVVEALREQINSSISSPGGLEALQAKVAAQASEISSLREQLSEARAAASVGPEALEDMDRLDRETTARFDANYAERLAKVEQLENQLTERNRALAEIRSYMNDVEQSLKSLDSQLALKTGEVTALQESLEQARQEAEQRITDLQKRADSGATSASEVDREQIQALHDELAAKSTAVQLLEAQLNTATNSVQALESQLTEKHQAVDAAIADAGKGDSHDEVIASIAQELRTPMSSIMGYTELLLRESVGILGTLQRKFLQRVKANTERMGVLLDDLIRISAIDRGDWQLNLERIDALYAVEETVMNVANQYREKGLTLRMALAEGLPAITADHDALIQVIGHLLTNAALASPVEGEVNLTVTMQRDNLPVAGGVVELDGLYVAVEDSGPGIAKDDYDKVFDRKYRADNPLIEGLGDTGVSMALAKTLVDLHGGRIWLDSKKNKGTTFHVFLPFGPLKGGAA